MVTRTNLIWAGAVALAVALAWLGMGWIAARAHAEGVHWQGCYVGAEAAYNSADASVFGAEGPGAGAYVGCDLQQQRFVIGPWVSYDWDWYRFAGTDIKTNGWAVGGRAGYLLDTNVLAYGLVGYADTTAKAFGGSIDLTGMEYGGGLEVALGGPFFGRLQYVHEDLSKASLDAKDNRVTLGFSYKFSWIGNEFIPARPLK